MELNGNIDINKYKVFLAVAELKSFSKAADYLHISQPAISHSIKELEDQLNIKLFIRNNKSVSLTESGEKMKGYVRDALNILSLGEKIIKEDDKNLDGIIRIGIYSHISLFMLPEVISEFRKKYPESKFSVYSTSNEEMIDKLKNNELDFIVLQYPIFMNQSNIKEEIVCKLDTCFFANKEYYDLCLNNPNSIKEIPVILPLRGFSDIDELNEELKSQNIILKHNFMCYSTELSIQLVKKGLGISWGIKRCVQKELENGNLYEVKMNFTLPTSVFSIAYNEKTLNKTTIEFIKLFKESMKKISK